MVHPHPGSEKREPSRPTRRVGSLLWSLLLGDRARWYVAPILIVALASMWRDYGVRVATTWPSVETFRRSPMEFVGKPFTVSYGRVVEVGERRLRLRSGSAEIDVLADPAGLSLGDVVSVRGAIRPDLRLASQQQRLHTGRRLKWLLGAAVLLGSAVVAGRELGGHA